MSKQIVIGRHGQQPFPLQDPKVSGRHAVLIVNDNGGLELVDTDSTNGTFIYDSQRQQFMRISPQRRYRVTPDTMIQLGPETRFHVRKLVPPPIHVDVRGAATQTGSSLGPKQPQSPAKVDISPLRRVSDFYNEEKMRLQGKLGNINSLRSLTLVASIAAGTGGGFLAEQLGFGGDNKIASGILGLGVAVILIVTLLLIINNMNQKLIRQQSENEKKYAMKYVCPKCGLSFRGKIYENILAEGRCPKCKAEYYEALRRR